MSVYFNNFHSPLLADHDRLMYPIIVFFSSFCFYLFIAITLEIFRFIRTFSSLFYLILHKSLCLIGVSSYGVCNVHTLGPVEFS